MPLLKHGHAPGHVRDAACAAFEAWTSWDGTGAEPLVEYEVHYEPHEIPLSRACKLVWNCTDIERCDDLRPRGREAPRRPNSGGEQAHHRAATG
jgi:hypothetical protein